jgi:hypothetical protein
MILVDFIDCIVPAAARPYNNVLERLQEAISHIRHRLLSRSIIILYDNTRPHTANWICDWLWCYGWEVMGYPRYIPDLMLNDFNPFWTPPQEASGCQMICNICQLETNFHLLAADTCHCFCLDFIMSLGAMPGHASVSVMSTWKSDMYYLLHMCHIHIGIRIKLSALLGLLPFFLNFCILLCMWKVYGNDIYMFLKLGGGGQTFMQ